MLPDLGLLLEAEPSKDTLTVLDRGLDAYNSQFAPAHVEEFAFALKTADGVVLGGVHAIAWAGMLYLKQVWIDEAYRGQRRGRALMLAVEAEGRRRGCTAACLDTFEFQARPFYEKLGYEVYGTLRFPAGFDRYFMKKAL